MIWTYFTQSATETGFSYLRFLHNNKVSTLLTSSINVFSPTVCKTSFFSCSIEVGWLGRKLAAILARPKQPCDVSSCVDFVQGLKLSVKIRDVASGLSPRISYLKYLRAARKLRTVSLTHNLRQSSILWPFLFSQSACAVHSS